MLNCYRKVYVELSEMRNKLQAVGVNNCAVYPNGRPKPGKLPVPSMEKDALRCVFFSIIQPEKGVDLILSAADHLPQMEFHFYGEIKKDYEEEFLAQISKITNAHYHGVFLDNSDAVYNELCKYDVLLLPTRWKSEGLPGILIEAKIAGVPAVVSDHNFNREIVIHGQDGIVITQINTQRLVEALSNLDSDREKLFNMKHSARKQAEKYYIEVCVSDIIRVLKEI